VLPEFGLTVYCSALNMKVIILKNVATQIRIETIAMVPIHFKDLQSAFPKENGGLSRFSPLLSLYYYHEVNIAHIIY